MTLVQFSLYEVFGYSFPGAFGLIGMYLVFWRIFFQPHQDWTNVSSGGWLLIFGIAYLSGHILQAIANLTMRKKSWLPELQILNSNYFSEQIKCLLAKRAREAVGLTGENELTPEVICEIADHFVMQHGKTEVRDIYVYREGFYRGMVFGLLFLAIGCFSQMGGNSTFAAAGLKITLTSSFLFWVAIVVVSMAILSLLRYFRFARYRVKFALYSLLNKGREECSHL